MWETRYGFPEPHRLPSGHRRYDEDQVELVKQVARDRESGLSMPAAIERARRMAARARGVDLRRLCAAAGPTSCPTRCPSAR